MELVIAAGALVAGFALLVKGASFFVDGASGIAARFGIPQIVIGLTIVAMGTSAPEAAISITAAVSGSADITIGNVVGSNILNIFIILGIAMVITPLAVQKNTTKYEIPFLVCMSLVILCLGQDGVIGFFDGVILAVFFGVYMGYLFFSSRKAANEKSEESQEADELEKSQDVQASESKTKSLPIQFLMTVGGIIAIVLGSNIAVYGATAIALAFGISERIIGLTIVALGTSLPELFTTVTAARKGCADIAIGNIVGSNIFNILFVVGVSSLITPVPYASNFMIDSIVAVIAGAMLLVFSITEKRHLKRYEGVIFLIAYACYFVYLVVCA